VLTQSETPGLGARAIEIKQGEKTPWFLSQFKGKEANSIELNDIEAITGATITSEAILSSVKSYIVDFLKESNINTFANQVLLFKNNTPENIFNEKINDSALSHNKELLAYTTDDSLQIINLNNSQIISSSVFGSSAFCGSRSSYFFSNLFIRSINGMLNDLLPFFFHCKNSASSGYSPFPISKAVSYFKALFCCNASLNDGTAT